MGKYSKKNNLTKKKCRQMNICHKCGGSLKTLKTANGMFLYKKQCQTCFTYFGGKNSVANNPINPNFNKKCLKTREKNNKSLSYKEFLKSPQWKKRRKEILIKDNRQCYFCGSDEFLNVHHCSYKDLLGDDLKTLCRKCHKLVHCIEKKHSKRFKELEMFKHRIIKNYKSKVAIQELPE